ncbi:hypothetical protein NE237_004944 [Protea cynaroides]|uniref:Bifunctional inhibitor/plant lipid transfer protein/seed storage helical domain-containing protein n=1 Tax=Protea cynaroides TaxID=273540 RepID=A0A9Q0QTT9_9MAGN|nr:hypothetical protein NE237_004944 [Protea cynaroides]
MPLPNPKSFRISFLYPPNANGPQVPQEIQHEHPLIHRIFMSGLLMAFSNTSARKVHGAGECGSTPVETEALKLAPCVTAGQDDKTTPSDKCCLQIQQIGKSPSCLCAVMLSQTAKAAGVKPEVAMTIPKRCNLANRPVGYKCGAYTLP